MKLNRAARVGITCTAALSLSLTFTGAAGGAERTQDAAAVELLRVAAAAFPAVAALPDSLGLKAPVMLHGTLKDSAGKPLSGAQVMLSAWPLHEVISKLPIGGTFDVVPVGHTVTDTEGRYELRSGLTPLLASLTGRDGLDLQLDIFHGDRHHISLPQVTPDQNVGGWVRSLLDDAPASKAAGERNALDLVLDPDMGQRLGPDYLHAPTSLPTSLPVSLPGDPPPAPPGCGRHQYLGEAPAMEEVISAFARNNVTISTTYKRNAKTESSTGASMNGGVNWSTGVAKSRTSGVKGKWRDVKAGPGVANGAIYRVEWMHDVSEQLCHKDMTGKHLRYALVSAPDVVTGSAVPEQVKPSWSCPAPGRGTRTRPVGWYEVATQKVRAKTYSAAFTFAPTGQGALTGSTTSGYDEAVEVLFKFKDETKAYWCGDARHPRAKGQIVQGFQVP